MAVKFLVKNTSNSDGYYRAQGQEKVLKKGESVRLDYPPEIASSELKVVEIKA